jgi:hypothetical protein
MPKFLSIGFVHLIWHQLKIHKITPEIGLILQGLLNEKPLFSPPSNRPTASFCDQYVKKRHIVELMLSCSLHLGNWESISISYLGGQHIVQAILIVILVYALQDGVRLMINLQRTKMQYYRWMSRLPPELVLTCWDIDLSFSLIISHILSCEIEVTNDHRLIFAASVFSPQFNYIQQRLDFFLSPPLLLSLMSSLFLSRHMACVSVHTRLKWSQWWLANEHSMGMLDLLCS